MNNIGEIMMNLFKNVGIKEYAYCIGTFLLSVILAAIFKAGGAPDVMLLVIACPVLAALLVLFFELGKSFFFKKAFSDKAIAWGGLGAVIAILVIGLFSNYL